MNKEEILLKVQSIFRDVLEDDMLIIEFNTTSNDIEEWDSLNHIQLIVAIEKYFNIRFTSAEIQNWKDVNEMIECIILKN
jgi:acyl carrier protein